MSDYRPICDVWILARPKVRYYGAYPNGFLERALALLGVATGEPVLHVCGGLVKAYPNKRFVERAYTLDSNPATVPDFLQDARDPLPILSPPYFGWPAVLCDPPYTEADAEHYPPGADALPTPNQILKNALAVVRIGGKVGMLHYALPQPPRAGAKFIACVGVIVGFNNRMRCFSVFERTA